MVIDCVIRTAGRLNISLKISPDSYHVAHEIQSQSWIQLSYQSHIWKKMFDDKYHLS